MFSSLLPKPKNALLETVKITLPKIGIDSSVIIPKTLLDTNDQIVCSSEGQSGTIQELVFESDGSINFAKTLSLASGGSGNVQASYEDTIPLKVRYPKLKHHFPSYTLANCPDDSLRICVEETREAIARALARLTGTEERAADSTLRNYTSSTFADQDTKTIHITSLREDPMLPPKFKLRNNRESQPAPPPPVLRATPAEKITKEVKDKWHIPSSISNWKNNQGFTIALDKRVRAASGGALPRGVEFNFESFSRLSQALETADTEVRENLEQKHKLRRQAVGQEKEIKGNLRNMLEHARSQRKRRPSDDHSSQKRRP